MAVALLIVIVSAAAGYLILLPSDPKSVHYIPYVTDSKFGQSTQYNWFNIVKDSIVVAAATVGLGGCVGGTFGACAAAAPAVSAIINGVLQDPIVTTTAEFEFTNSGNGTATNVNFGVAIYVDGSLIQTSYYSLQNLVAGSSYTQSFTYVVPFSSLPIAVWNAIRTQGSVDIEVVKLTYGGRT